MTGSTVVLLAHGSPDPRHASAVEAAAQRCRRRLPGVATRTAYLETDDPAPADLGAELVGEVVLVPLLITPAYHARVDVPGAARSLAAAGATVHIAEPLGPDLLLLEAVAERLAADGYPADPTTEVVLVAGGSSDGAAVRSLRDLVATSAGPGWGPWHGTSLREPDGLSAAAQGATERGHRLVVTAFVLAEGVIHDAAADLAAGEGVPFVPGGLLETESLDTLVARRASALSASLDLKRT